MAKKQKNTNKKGEFTVKFEDTQKAVKKEKTAKAKAKDKKGNNLSNVKSFEDFCKFNIDSPDMVKDRAKAAQFLNMKLKKVNKIDDIDLRIMLDDKIALLA